MGGIHFIPGEDGFTPLLWRQKFPSWIQNRLVSFSNPNGDINNIDLELSGSFAQNDILAQAADVTKKKHPQLLR